MAWHLLEKMIEHSAAHSTLLGKWWIAFMFVFRIIVVASIGDTVYSDEQDEFTCNTKQPGCKQVCYNMFAPISHIRFWAFQILATGTPSVIFIIFAMHKLALVPKEPEGDDAKKESSSQTSWRYASEVKKERKQQRDKIMKERNANQKNGRHSNSSNMRKKNNKSEKSIDAALLSRHSYPISRHNDYDDASSVFPVVEMEKVCRENKLRRTKRLIVRCYVFNVLFRAIIEAACMFAQFYLYRWSVPEFYECIRYPCPKIVECYISRPMEKTIFLYFMFAVGGICVLLNIFELKYLGYRKLRRACCPVKEEKFVPPSITQGTYADILNSKYHVNGKIVPQSNKARVIEKNATHAPPGYYIPDVLPPTETYHSPAAGFPPIRVGAGSFTTSETDVTSDQDSLDSVPSLYRERTVI